MKTLLMIGSGRSYYREYALRAISQHYRIVLLQPGPLTWQAPYVSDFAEVAPGDIEEAVSAAHRLAGKQKPVGICTYEEESVEACAAVAEDLQFPFNSRESMRLCRDKHLMHHAWARAGVPAARSCLVNSIEEIVRAAQDFGYPVVVKPRGMAMSIGVVRVDSQADIPSAFSIANLDLHPTHRLPLEGLLVEEYLDGPEYSVESVLVNGDVKIISITRKQVGLAPFFEEMGHIVSPGEVVPHEQAIREVVSAAHRALDVRIGVTHAELRVTAQGPRMIEMNARCAGDLIPHLVNLATGIDLSVVAAAAAAGDPLTLTPTQSGAAAIRFIYPEHDGTVRRLAIADTMLHELWMERLVWVKRVGEEVLLPPRSYIPRLGYIVVTGETAAECRERCEHVLAQVEIVVEA